MVAQDRRDEPQNDPKAAVGEDAKECSLMGELPDRLERHVDVATCLQLR
jgi:hypothetical protein